MSSQQSSDLFKDFENAVRDLIRATSPLIRRIGNNFRLLNQVFQAYVYTLLAYATRKSGIRVNPQNVPGGKFVFKLATRGDPRRYSYFIMDKDGDHFSLLLNANVNVSDLIGDIAWSWNGISLNLDIVLAKGNPVLEPVKRGDVVFFVECKSVRRVSPEYAATVMGQKLLVKYRLGGSGNHPYANIPDILAVRGKASFNTRALVQLIKNKGWVFVVDVVDTIAPYQSGKNTMVREVASLLRRF